jgi:hypothetical protein
VVDPDAEFVPSAREGAGVAADEHGRGAGAAGADRRGARGVAAPGAGEGGDARRVAREEEPDARGGAGAPGDGRGVPGAADGHREAFDRQLRSSIASLGESLLALDPSLEHELELELQAEAFVSNPRRIAAGGGGIESVEQGLTAALGILEELAAGAKTFGVEPRDALGVLSEEFSKIVV